MNRILLIFRVLMLLAFILFAQQAFALQYMPYEGVEGYQEIGIAQDIYFVACHGDQKASASEVDAAWRTRAAQLCISNGADQFVELQYSFEPVLMDDPPLFSSYREGSGSFIVQARGSRGGHRSGHFGPRYGGFYGGYYGWYYGSPMFTGSRTARRVFIDAPTRQAHIRCVQNEDVIQVIEPERLIDAAKILEEAGSRGWLTQGK